MIINSTSNNFTLNGTTNFNSTTPMDISGCVAYFDFNTSGTIFYDSIVGYIGNCVSGTLDYGGGRISGCPIYNGSTSFLNINGANGLVVSNLGSFAVSIWINYAGSSLGISGGTACILGGRYGDNTTLSILTDLKIETRTDDSARTSNANSITKNKWEHLCFNYSRNSGSPIYPYWETFVNGRMITNGSYLYSTGQPYTSQALFVGFEDRRKFAFNGKIDELSIFNKNLSNQEVNQLYNLGYTKFNNLQSTNSNLILSGTENTFTLQNQQSTEELTPLAHFKFIGLGSDVYAT